MSANRSRWMVALILVVPVLNLPSNTFGQLPSEATIPGKEILDVERLPSESVIPGQPIAKQQWPLESTIPPTSTRQEPQKDATAKAGDRNQLDAIKEFLKRPLLRVLGGGPIAPLQSICFSSDSKRIFAGGLDKTLHVWQQFKRPGNAARWVYEKPVYWQINRATAGHIFSVAAGSKNIVFGGVGASASNGEIVLVDAKTVEFSRALVNLDVGHTESIFSIATTKDNSKIVSIDVAGRTVAWNPDPETGIWKANVLRESDYQLFNKQTADELLQRRVRGGGIAIADSGATVYPEVSLPFNAGTFPNWHLVHVDANGIKTRMAAPELHRGMVAAISCSADGSRIVSADIRNNGRMFYWDLKRSNTAKVLQFNFPIRCLDVSSDGAQIAFGTAKNVANVARVELLRWLNDNSIKKIGGWNEDVDVEACSFDTTHARLAYTQGPSIVIRDTTVGRDMEILNSNTNHPHRVAFSSTKGDYRVALRSKNEKNFQSSFDPNQLTLD